MIISIMALVYLLQIFWVSQVGVHWEKSIPALWHNWWSYWRGAASSACNTPFVLPPLSDPSWNDDLPLGKLRGSGVVMKLNNDGKPINRKHEIKQELWPVTTSVLLLNEAVNHGLSKHDPCSYSSRCSGCAVNIILRKDQSSAGGSPKAKAGG